jgi:signal transduction histidine kinase
MKSDLKERVILHSLICLMSVLFILSINADGPISIPTSLSITSSFAMTDESLISGGAPSSSLIPYSGFEFAGALPLYFLGLADPFFKQPNAIVTDVEASPTPAPAAAASPAISTRLTPAISFLQNNEIVELLTATAGGEGIASVLLAPLGLLLLLLLSWRWCLIALAIIITGFAMLTFEQYRAARVKELNEALCESEELTTQLTIQQMELGKAYRTLALDYAVIRALNESPTPKEAAYHILQTICVSTGWDLGLMWDVEPQSKKRLCIGRWQPGSSPARQTLADAQGEALAGRSSLLDAVVNSRTPQWIQAPNASLLSSSARSFGAKPWQSALAFPVINGGEIIGALEFYSEDVRQPDADLNEVLATIASHIGQLIQRQRAEEALCKSQNDHLIELQRVRRRIATDLHDDVGSSLTKIALLSETVRQKVSATNPEAGERLATLSRISNELVDTMSDIVWAINPKNDRLSTLSQRMRRYASDIFTARQIRFRFQPPDSDAVLGANLRREVFLIFKESVNNVVKHSGCSEVVFNLAVTRDSLTFNISDNGQGIDPKILNADTGYLAAQLKGGNGLANMRRRARELGGRFEIVTGKTRGTTVSLNLPFVCGLSVSK